MWEILVILCNNSDLCCIIALQGHMRCHAMLHHALKDSHLSCLYNGNPYTKNDYLSTANDLSSTSNIFPQPNSTLLMNQHWYQMIQYLLEIKHDRLVKYNQDQSNELCHECVQWQDVFFGYTANHFFPSFSRHLWHKPSKRTMIITFFSFGIAVMHSFCAEFPMSVLKSVLWIKWSISLWCFYGMYVGVSLREYNFVAYNVNQFMEEMEYKWQLYPAVNSSVIVPNVCSAML